VTSYAGTKGTTVPWSCSPLIERVYPQYPQHVSECNGDLYEAAGAADATACSRIGSW
jgi:hypothetical protein